MGFALRDLRFNMATLLSGMQRRHFACGIYLDIRQPSPIGGWDKHLVNVALILTNYHSILD